MKKVDENPTNSRVAFVATTEQSEAWTLARSFVVFVASAHGLHLVAPGEA